LDALDVVLASRSQRTAEWEDKPNVDRRGIRRRRRI
jgi:hypothetical protein